MSLQERFDHYTSTLERALLPAKGIFISDIHGAAGDDHDPLKRSGREKAILDLLDEFFSKGYDLFLSELLDTWRGYDLLYIYPAHLALLQSIHRFEEQGRLHRALGNHEMNLCTLPEVLLFEGYGKKLFFDHGHIEDFFSDQGWTIGREAVRVSERLGIVPELLPHPSNAERHLRVIQMRDELARNNPHWTFIFGHTHLFRNAGTDPECPLNVFTTDAAYETPLLGYQMEEGNIFPLERC